MNREYSRVYEALVHPRGRLIAAVAIACFVYGVSFVIPSSEIRILLAFDLGMLALLGSIALMMTNADAEETFRRQQRLEPSHAATLIAAIICSATSLVVVALMLDNTQKLPALVVNIHMGLSMIAIFEAWLLVHTFFALHYARMYYDEVAAGKEEYLRGLEFPNEGLVDHWDFMYYSFTIGMCYQTSDISITGIHMRRITLIHSILSFIFVTAVIGLVVNIVSNII
ncbi:hypothetical protein DO97_15475 [Neosynechococcus sphagnicola sy1]|uniref:DUF1345 domain-containing protein n=1 Tax=Neosynechococcus sphagnicola sy1 TaxID=1497020 RepID=A0A098TID4_9CYAN|nr:DUF1345 domain-containing protein [Neosynechococcus sphagnicola]KGF71786.1 hypothetical protein DO97_15475 [Neosynechococcus sphagnicola sy1]